MSLWTSMANRSEVGELQERLQSAVLFTQTSRIELLSALCREKEEDLLHLEARLTQLSEALDTQKAVNSRLNYHLAVMTQDGTDAKQRLIERFAQEIKAKGMLMEAARSPDLEAMRNEYEEIRSQQDQNRSKRQTLEEALRTDRMTFAGLADQTASLRREGNWLTQTLQAAEDKLKSFQDLAAAQTSQLRKLQREIQDEREVQQAANYHQSLTRSSSPGTAGQSAYFPSILRSFRSVTNLRD